MLLLIGTVLLLTWVLSDQQPGQDQQVRNIMDYGAVGDGVTSDQTAWNAAYAATPAGGIISLQAGKNFVIPDAVIIDKPVRIEGTGSSIIKPYDSRTVERWWTVSADNVAIVGITFIDQMGRVTNAQVALSDGSRGGEILRNNFAPHGSTSVRVEDSHDVSVAANSFDGSPVAIHVSGESTNVNVEGNDIRNWSNLGIYLVGTESGSPSDVIIQRNRVSDLKEGGYPRYPIHADQGPALTMLHNIEVMENTIVGPDKAWTAAEPGTADQISMFHIDGLVVSGNVSRDGGDMGITVEASDDVEITENVVTRADVAGIAIWTDVVGATVTGNKTMNNGQNRNGDRLPAGRAGIRLASSSTTGPTDVTISGNVTGDDQVVKTQQYGVSISESTNISLGPNTDRDNAVSLYFGPFKPAE